MHDPKGVGCGEERFLRAEDVSAVPREPNTP